jgi:hypothetical protein
MSGGQRNDGLDTDMTALTELREEAALHPEGTRAKRLLTWAEIHFSDSAERILELEEELTAKDIECSNLRIALIKLRDVQEAMATYARDCTHSFNPEIFSRDFAPFINLMGGHGDPDYLKGDMSCRHVDLRQKAPKKTKGAQKP